MTTSSDDGPPAAPRARGKDKRQRVQITLEPAVLKMIKRVAERTGVYQGDVVGLVLRNLGERELVERVTAERARRTERWVTRQ